MGRSSLVFKGRCGGLTLQLCDRLVAAAMTATVAADYLKQTLPEIVSDLSIQWAAVLGRTPAWAVESESGRRAVGELPTRFLEETLDREAGGFLPVGGPGGAATGSFIATPLPNPDRPGSLLVLFGRALTPDVLPSALILGRALGLAVRIVQHRERGTQRTDRLRATLKISSQFAAARDSQSLLDLIAREATRLLASDRASIFIWDKPQHEIVACPALGVDGGFLRLPDNVGIVGEVIQTGRSIRVDDAYQDPRFNKAVDAKSGYRTRNLLCVPLVDAEGQRIGAFEAINKLVGDFNADDEESLSELGIQAAIALRNTREREQLVRQREQRTEEVTRGVRIIGESAPIVALRENIDRLAATDLPVLILGESGTGKEVVSQALHYRGGRRDNPFIAINCAALTESLLESELFGHEKGAFTDAHEMRQGKFELASEGTLFLDEIGDMSPGGQAKLLRVLEQKVVTRVGGSQAIPTNVRVVAATNTNLAQAVRDKRFRQDLYYRLSVVTVELPPLRERSQDILLLAHYFLEHFCRQAKRRALTLSPEAAGLLEKHSWPGNIRELRNLMERLAFLCPGDRIEAEDLVFILSAERDVGAISMDASGLTEATASFQREFIRQAIKRSKGNMSKAADALGLHRSNLYRKMRQLKMAEAEGNEDDEPDE